MGGDIFCCYLMGRWECVSLRHWTWVLHEIISRFCYLSPPSCFPYLRVCISLLLSSTIALHCLVSEYFSSWNCITFFVCLFVCVFLFPLFSSTVLYQQSHSAAWDEASLLHFTSQPCYHTWCIFLVSLPNILCNNNLYFRFSRRGIIKLWCFLHKD